MAQRKKVTKAATPTGLKGVSLAAMIVGILAVVFSWIPFWGSVTGLAALALGIIGLVKHAPSRGMALAGTILGAVGFLLSLIAIVAWLLLFAAGAAATDPGQPVPQPYPYMN